MPITTVLQSPRLSLSLSLSLLPSWEQDSSNHNLTTSPKPPSHAKVPLRNPPTTTTAFTFTTPKPVSSLSTYSLVSEQCYTAQTSNL
jgi:hypothetical protein